MRPNYGEERELDFSGRKYVKIQCFLTRSDRFYPFLIACQPIANSKKSPNNLKGLSPIHDYIFRHE